jgi:hypothetical protein
MGNLFIYLFVQLTLRIHRKISSADIYRCSISQLTENADNQCKNEAKAQIVTCQQQTSAAITLYTNFSAHRFRDYYINYLKYDHRQNAQRLTDLCRILYIYTYKVSCYSFPLLFFVPVFSSSFTCYRMICRRRHLTPSSTNNTHK